MKKIMNPFLTTVLMITISLTLSGCCAFKTEPLFDEDGKVTSKKAALCTKCGQAKWTAVCCKAGAPTCDLCGMAQGAPGCCASQAAE